MIKKIKRSLAHLGVGSGFGQGTRVSEPSVSEVFPRGMSSLLSFLCCVTEHPLVAYTCYWHSPAWLTLAELLWLPLPQSYSPDYRLKTAGTVSVLWGSEDVWINV